MERIQRGDDHRFDFGIGDHFFAGRVSLDSVLVGNRLAEIDVCVRAGNDLCAGKLVVDALDVCAANRAGPYQTNFQFRHDILLLY